MPHNTGIKNTIRINMNIELFIKQRGLNPQEKLDNNTGGYWKLKDLLEDFVDCQNEGQSLPIDSVSNCSKECEWKAETFDNIGMPLTEYCEGCGAKRDCC